MATHKIVAVLWGATVFLLAGFTLFNSIAEQFRVAGTHSAVDATTSVVPPPEPTPTNNGNEALIANSSTADELDLKTGFKITDEPTLREYVFNITREFAAPDGVSKSMILINGRSPGPLIEANAGDTLRIMVNNMLVNESTTIHWHGIDQRNTSWMDGVHGVSQCGIPPGETFTYEFTLVDQRGSFWYHAHLSVQYTDGLYGPLIIHDPDEKIPPVDDDKIIMIGDLWHGQSEQAGPNMQGMDPPVDNLIINGQHIFNCSFVNQKFHSHSESSHHPHPHHPHQRSTDCTGGSLYSTRVKASDHIRLRLISHSTSVPYWFSIDGHVLQIVEIDGVEVEPILTTRVFMNPGQRYSVIIVADQPVGNYAMRAVAARSCFHYMGHKKEWMPTTKFEATAILSYDDTDTEAKLIGNPWNLKSTNNTGVGNEPWIDECSDLPFDLPRPMRERRAYEVGSRNRHYFDFRVIKSEEGARTLINETYFRPVLDNATLWVASQPSASSDSRIKNVDWDFGPDQHVLHSDEDGGAQIVINSKNMMIHPWHLHGIKTLKSSHKMTVVGWGEGSFGANPTTWNLQSPMRRDTVTVPGLTHVVIRIEANNPGIWAFHCHILWHAEGGMFTLVAQRMKELGNLLEPLRDPDNAGSVWQKFCRAGSDGAK
ncbi:hypothetical protein NM208_g655 [Fusarium decemcellulare]|uniref:Uncharacterized protein n=1 Tax=Fusarium decemcellulare TaxID=57161 RepID=A0ACC1SYX0_9HYPO|nr:hypothetical protein NM208_g655 [Fusarium decemcellulare]